MLLSNIGGGIFTYTYKDTEGFTTSQYNNSIKNNVKSTNINIKLTNISNSSSKNRGGGIYCYYNTNLICNDNNIFTNNNSNYGNDIYMSDQCIINVNSSKFDNNNQNNNGYIIGSTNNNIIRTPTFKYTSGLIYIDYLDEKSTNIFQYNNNTYTKELINFII